MVNIKNLDLNNIKIDKKQHKSILIYHIAYIMVEDLRRPKMNSVKPLYLHINKINGYIERPMEINI